MNSVTSLPQDSSRRLFMAAIASMLPLARTASADAVGAPQAFVAGLDFPGSAAVGKTMRFRFLNPLPIYPATYVWWALPRRQAGYYTAFFWGNDDGKGDLRTFLWTPSGAADSYYGAHPYPHPRPHGTNHHWEISVVQEDFVNGAVDYDRWHRQALRVWADASGKYHEFYWDLPLTDRNHRVSYKAPAHWGERMPPVPALTWGDAPWAPGKEVWNGVMRGIQIYAACLTVGEILREGQRPRSTSIGERSLWYLNLDPRPDDIADKSGRNHHPQWVGPERPRLWAAPRQDFPAHWPGKVATPVAGLRLPARGRAGPVDPP
jgi:hypothetical protein